MSYFSMQKMRKLGILFGIYIALLICLELIGQFFIHYTESRRPTGIFAEKFMSLNEPLLDFALKRNYHENLVNWNVSTNSLGYRVGNPFTLEKKNTLRIVIVGGSTVFGWGVNYEETIPAYLQTYIDTQLKESRNLANIGKKIEVINAGIPLYSSWNEAALIFHRILTLEPDWIIAFDGLNDTARSLSPEWNPIHLGYLDWATITARERSKNTFKVEDILMEAFKLSTTFNYFYTKMKFRSQLSEGAFHPEVWSQYIRYHNQIQKLCAASGIRYSMFFQPVMLVDKPLNPIEVKTNFTGMRNEKIAEFFTKTYILGETEVLKSTLPVKSLRTIFSKIDEPIYHDGLHYNAKGNKILATEIFRTEILPNLSNIISRN